MIDLHTHTTESDGTLNPNELLQGAQRIGLEAIGITDHDTFDGYDSAATFALHQKIDLLCGIELSVRFGGYSVHLLGYFLDGNPSQLVRGWVKKLQETRHTRNLRLVELLCAHGLVVTVDEIYDRGGKLPGRPHFATILTAKGYASSRQEAFDRYLGETGTCYVSRDEPTLGDALKIIAAAGGVSSLAHPLRVTRQRDRLECVLRRMQADGLIGLEVYHSEHTCDDTTFLQSLATRLDLMVTGGSDFHGATKPNVLLGTGIAEGLNVPRWVLENLRFRSEKSVQAAS
jgi:3',5'-nucleoside bisphosphate phosphatase